VEGSRCTHPQPFPARTPSFPSGCTPPSPAESSEGNARYEGAHVPDPPCRVGRAGEHVRHDGDRCETRRVPRTPPGGGEGTKTRWLLGGRVSFTTSPAGGDPPPVGVREAPRDTHNPASYVPSAPCSPSYPLVPVQRPALGPCCGAPRALSLPPVGCGKPRAKGCPSCGKARGEGAARPVPRGVRPSVVYVGRGGQDACQATPALWSWLRCPLTTTLVVTRQQPTRGRGRGLCVAQSTIWHGGCPMEGSNHRSVIGGGRTCAEGHAVVRCRGALKKLHNRKRATTAGSHRWGGYRGP
jgi:hypothetical protein